MNKNIIDVIILHDSDGRPYYEAIEYLKKHGYINNIYYYESTITKQLVKSLIKKEVGKMHNSTLKKIFSNYKFRIRTPFIKNKTIIMGMAPYDIRIIWYQQLLKNNNLILHTSWPFWGTEKYPKKYNSFINNLAIKIWRKFLSQQKLKIVCVTEEVKNSLINNFDVKGYIVTIPHCVNTRIFYPDKGKDFNKEKLKILFVGKFLKHKGIDILTEIIKTIDPQKYIFYIVGDGPYKSKLENIFTKKNVKYFGFINSKETLASIYRKSDIFISPSIKNDKWEELFGIALLEAMASGLTVIASDHIGPKNLIKDGHNGFLVKDRDIYGFIEKLHFLYNNRNLLKKIGINARREVLKFDVKRISNMWLEPILK